MDEGDSDDGYLDGRATVADSRAPQPSPTCTREDQRGGKTAFQLYFVWRADALEHFQPTSG